jgi:hypothetical protein
VASIVKNQNKGKGKSKGEQLTLKANDKKDQTTSFGTEIPVDDNNDVNNLGNGYDSITEALKGATSIYVKSDGGTAVKVGNTESQFSVGVDLSHKAILDNISGGASADLSFSSVDVSGNIAIANQSAADSYVGTYTLFARVKPEKTVLLPTSVSEGGVAASDLAGTGVGLVPTANFLGWQGILGNGQPLMDKVGDEFIHAIEYGAWLMVTLTFV